MNIPGWEKCDSTDAQAQLVNGEWWRPAFGCDSLQMCLDEIKRLRAAIDFIATTGDQNGGELYPVGQYENCFCFLNGKGKTFLDAVEDEMGMPRWSP